MKASRTSGGAPRSESRRASRQALGKATASKRAGKAAPGPQPAITLDPSAVMDRFLKNSRLDAASKGMLEHLGRDSGEVRRASTAHSDAFLLEPPSEKLPAAAPAGAAKESASIDESLKDYASYLGISSEALVRAANMLEYTPA